MDKSPQTQPVQRLIRAWGPLLVVVAASGYFLLVAWLSPLPVSAQAPCGEPAVLLSDLQGSPSSRLGEWVTTEAVVTADFTGEDQLRGFFYQQPMGDQSTAGASRALFVFAPEAAVNAGERLRLRGRVSKFHGMTQLSDITVKARCGHHGPVRPVLVSLPVTETRRQSLQGMVIELQPPLVVTGNYSLGRYGSLLLADERLRTPTQVVPPGEPARARAAEGQARILRLDDRRRTQFPDIIPYPPPQLTAENSVRVGDRLEALTGVLDYRYDHWRLQPLSRPEFRRSNPRPSPPPSPEKGQVRLAVFNVANYFNGHDGFPTARGAQSPRELERQEAKLGAVLEGLQASVVALVEVANDGDDRHSSVASLAALAGEHWRWARHKGARTGQDEIAVGLIYDANEMTAEGQAMSPDSPAFARHNRPPLAQWLRHKASGERLLVVVNHWKSKSCDQARGENRDRRDGQSCWNPVREAAARELLQWLETLSPEDNTPVLLLGDFNAYARETPLAKLHRAGYANLLGGRASTAYTYVYKGQSGTLDYALGNRESQHRLTAMETWSVNSDEAPVLDYRLRHRSPQQRRNLFSDGPWRASDHDPLWLDLALTPAR